MANYIDQDELLESVERIACEYDDPAMALVEIVSTIEWWGHPLVDPEIAKHGKWLLHYDNDDRCMCGNCSFVAPEPYKRCPDCGAFMEVDNG